MLRMRARANSWRCSGVRIEDEVVDETRRTDVGSDGYQSFFGYLFDRIEGAGMDDLEIVEHDLWLGGENFFGGRDQLCGNPFAVFKLLSRFLQRLP